MTEPGALVLTWWGVGFTSVLAGALLVTRNRDSLKRFREEEIGQFKEEHELEGKTVSLTSLRGDRLSDRADGARKWAQEPGQDLSFLTGPPCLAVFSLCLPPYHQA